MLFPPIPPPRGLLSRQISQGQNRSAKHSSRAAEERERTLKQRRRTVDFEKAFRIIKGSQYRNRPSTDSLHRKLFRGVLHVSAHREQRTNPTDSPAIQVRAPPETEMLKWNVHESYSIHISRALLHRYTVPTSFIIAFVLHRILYLILTSALLSFL